MRRDPGITRQVGIYQPQDQNDTTGRYMDPSKGLNYEVGVKAQWLDQRLLTTVALFKAEQENLATFAGMNDSSQYYYTGVDVDSKGIELEVVGRPGQNVDMVLGHTTPKLEGAQRQDIYECVPRHTENIALSARVPSLSSVFWCRSHGGEVHAKTGAGSAEGRSAMVYLKILS